MAWTFEGSIGEAQEKVSDTGLLFTATEIVPVGNLCVCSYSVDNVATSSGATTLGTVTDESVNTWNRIEFTHTLGAAADGTTTGIAWSVITTQIDAGDDLILTLSSSVTAKAFVGAHWSRTGSTVELLGSNQEGNTDTEIVDVTLSGLSSNAGLWIYAVGIERTITTASFAGGYATAETVATSGGGAESNQTIYLAYLISSSTSSTAECDTQNASNESQQILAAFREFTAGATEDPYPYVVGGYYPTEG